MKEFLIWWPEVGQVLEDARCFTAHDHTQAVEAWARWYDAYSNDYALIDRGQPACIEVLQVDSNELKTIKVSGHMERVYTTWE
ncbi:hypothetical protein [Sinimarinibacterium sp. NLF-5-8]|uniref:hypothetical protein n=1 Tax=Sinimarinibacterium sp. NLF-5-8 TaxID=2698684 RepID=UPI00137C0E92|nr:hypothetical protein [Sinimarinibacterium sp. NLF-5-8]QHS09060.1 hypothetical protein GT972_02130 [Sinimarinibacterium sp. NLF-5-8]